MWGQGKKISLIVIVLTLLFAATTLWYTNELATQRDEVLATIPQNQECGDNSGRCPQAENIQVPNTLGIAILILAIILAGYLFRSDSTQQQILRELRDADEKNSNQEQLTLILSILKKEEKKVLLAIKEQDGITQNTLRLRTDFSKAKLSSLLKELENRGLVKKEPEGKTNKLYLKRNL